MIVNFRIPVAAIHVLMEVHAKQDSQAKDFNADVQLVSLELSAVEQVSIRNGNIFKHPFFEITSTENQNLLGLKIVLFFSADAHQQIELRLILKL